MSHLPNDPAATPRARQLTRIVEMLARSPEVRADLVADIRRQVAEGRYTSEEKLDVAIGRMLKDILK